jgi:hypothetical protein
MQISISLVGLLVYNSRFWNSFKNNNQIVNLMIGLQQRPDLGPIYKQKVLRIIKTLTLKDHR